MEDSDFTDADHAHMRFIKSTHDLAQSAQVDLTPTGIAELKEAVANLADRVRTLKPTK